MDVRPPCERGLSNVRRNGFPFRHELRLRVLRAKLGAELFEPLINATGDLRTCVQCFKMATKMLRCAGCKWARYCDRVCQKADWRTHRTECCPDHSLPKYQRSIPYQRAKVCHSCRIIDRRVAMLTQSDKMLIHRRAGEERCAAMAMAVSALTAPSAVSAPSSSSGSRQSGHSLNTRVAIRDDEQEDWLYQPMRRGSP